MQSPPAVARKFRIQCRSWNKMETGGADDAGRELFREIQITSKDSLPSTIATPNRVGEKLNLADRQITVRGTFFLGGGEGLTRPSIHDTTRLRDVGHFSCQRGMFYLSSPNIPPCMVELKCNRRRHILHVYYALHFAKSPGHTFVWMLRDNQTNRRRSSRRRDGLLAAIGGQELEATPRR